MLARSGHECALVREKVTSSLCRGPGAHRRRSEHGHAADRGGHASPGEASSPLIRPRLSRVSPARLLTGLSARDLSQRRFDGKWVGSNLTVVLKLEYVATRVEFQGITFDD